MMLLSELATVLLMAGSICQQGAGPSLGPPPTKALKTTEIRADSEARLKRLIGQDDANNALFLEFKNFGQSQWNKAWPYRFDMSGISWRNKKAGTVITPRHVVFAAHYPYKLGQKIIFHDRSGKPHTRKVSKIYRLNKDGRLVADIAVGFLDQPLPKEIKVYRLLPPRADLSVALAGCPVLVTEQSRNLYIHRIRRIALNGVSFEKNTDFPDSLHKPLIGGDSGHPSFLVVGGEPVLIETHTGGGPGAGPFYSGPDVFAALEKLIEETDPRYRIQTVPLDPELAPIPAPKSAPQESSTHPPRTTPANPRVRRAPQPPNN